MRRIFTKKLGLQGWKTEVRALKIDGLILKIFGMVMTSFSIDDKFEKSRFFEEIFFLTDNSMDIVLGMFFLTLSNAKIHFLK